MTTLKINDRLYNHGDMANNSSWATIKRIEKCNGYGTIYHVEYDKKRFDNDTLKGIIQSYIVDDIYKNNGSTRIVTEKAYNDYWNELKKSI